MLTCRSAGARLDGSTDRCRGVTPRLDFTARPALVEHGASAPSTTGSHVHSAAQCGTSISAGAPGCSRDLGGRMVAQVGGDVDITPRGRVGLVEQEVTRAADHGDRAATSRSRSPATRAPTAVAGRVATTSANSARVSRVPQPTDPTGASRRRHDRPARRCRRRAPRTGGHVRSASMTGGARAAAPPSRPGPRQTSSHLATACRSSGSSRLRVGRCPRPGAHECAPVVVADRTRAAAAIASITRCTRRAGQSVTSLSSGSSALRSTSGRRSTSPSANARDSETPSRGESALVCATYSADAVRDEVVDHAALWDCVATVDRAVEERMVR